MQSIAIINNSVRACSAIINAGYKFCYQYHVMIDILLYIYYTVVYGDLHIILKGKHSQTRIKTKMRTFASWLNYTA